MNPLWKPLALSFVRKLVTIAATALVTNGWMDPSASDEVIAGVSLLIVSVVWSAWDRYRERAAFTAALESAPGTPVERVLALAAQLPLGDLK